MKYKYNGQWVDVTIKALDSMVIGSIIQFVGTTIPTGWLECDGSTITQSAYPELYDLIGGTLPDFRGRVLVGQDTNDTDFDTLGETGGDKTHKHTGGSHSHGLANGYACIGTGWDGSNILRQQTKGSITAGTRVMQNMPGYNNTSSSAYDATALGGSTDAGGVVDTTSSSSLQPYAVVKHIIKAKNTTPTMASVVNATNSSTTDAYSCDYVNNLVDYSTTETKTGKKWIDGKPIYRKVVEDTTNSTANTWKSLSLTNVDHIISYSGELVASSSETFVLPMATDTRAIWFKVTSNTLHEAHNTDYFNSKDMVLIVEYTKTTN